MKNYSELSAVEFFEGKELTPRQFVEQLLEESIMNSIVTNVEPLEGVLIKSKIHDLRNHKPGMPWPKMYPGDKVIVGRPEKFPIIIEQ